MNKDKSLIEMDLLRLGQILWKSRKNIIRCSATSVLIGLVIIFSIPKEYTTSVIFTVNSSKSSSDNIGSLAPLAGLDVHFYGEDVFSPELYSDVINSTPFIQRLLKVNLVDDNQNANISLYNYLKNNQKVAWWSYIFKINNILSSENDKSTKKISRNRYISREEMELIERMKNVYSISTDKKTGLTTIDVTVQSPQISALLVDTLVSYLQTYIIEERTKKAKIDLYNSMNIYEQAKLSYYDSQQSLATFIDANMNMISARYKINQEKLQNEVNLAYSLYNRMAQQVQINKTKVQDDTPVFTIIQPAIEPLSASKPNKRKVITISILLSVIGASAWFLLKDYIIRHKSHG